MYDALYMITMNPSREEPKTDNLQVQEPYPPSSYIICFFFDFIHSLQRYYCVKLKLLDIDNANNYNCYNYSGNWLSYKWN